MIDYEKENLRLEWFQRYFQPQTAEYEVGNLVHFKPGAA